MLRIVVGKKHTIHSDIQVG